MGKKISFLFENFSLIKFFAVVFDSFPQEILIDRLFGLFVLDIQSFPIVRFIIDLPIG